MKSQSYPQTDDRSKRTEKRDLQPVKTVLQIFAEEMAKLRNLREAGQGLIDAMASPESADPDSDCSPSLWQKEEAYAWIYAEPQDYRPFMQRPPSPTITGYYAEPASPIYEEWKFTEKDFFYRGSIIPPPGATTLGEYLLHLRFLVTTKNERRAVWHKSLRSFLEYLRLDMESDQLYPLEVLFPEWMVIRPGYTFQRRDGTVIRVECQTITRKIQDTAFPIDILAVSEILENLASTVLYGRPNSQQRAAEALGFSWLCLAVGQASMPAIEEVIFSTPLSALRSLNLPGSAIQYQIYAKTVFGGAEISISRILYEFLLALPQDPECDLIFSSSWRAVYRSLVDKGIKKSKRAAVLGKISFLTFMSPSHEAFGQRYSLPKK